MLVCSLMVQTHWLMYLLGHDNYLLGVRTAEWIAGDDGRGAC
jgi:hypothetical protein